MAGQKDRLEEKRLLEAQLYLIDRTIGNVTKVQKVRTQRRKGKRAAQSASAADLIEGDTKLPQILPRSNSQFLSQTGGNYTGRRIPGREDEIRARDKTLGRTKKSVPAAPGCPPISNRPAPAKAFHPNGLATHSRLKNLMREVDNNLVRLTLPENVVDQGGWHIATRSNKTQLRDKSHSNPLVASKSWLQS